MQLAADAGEAIVRIRNSTRQVTQTVASISESILEQGAASNTIAEQVEQVARASEQNSAIARQSAALGPGRGATGRPDAPGAGAFSALIHQAQ